MRRNSQEYQLQEKNETEIVLKNSQEYPRQEKRQKEAPKHEAPLPRRRQIELHALPKHAGELLLAAEQFAKSGAFSLVHFFFRQIKKKEQYDETLLEQLSFNPSSSTPQKTLYYKTQYNHNTTIPNFKVALYYS